MDPEGHNQRYGGVQTSLVFYSNPQVIFVCVVNKSTELSTCYAALYLVMLHSRPLGRIVGLTD